MAVTKKRIVTPALVVVAAALALVGWTRVSARDDGGFKLEGAWVARVTSYNGAAYPYLTQWSYVVAPDASGRKASYHGSVDVPFPGPAAGDYASPIIGEMTQTGPDTLADTSIWYQIQKASPVNQIIVIGMARGEGRWLARDTIEYTVHFAIYLPSADTNGDGIPEGDPVKTFTVTTKDTRVPLPQ